MLSRAYFFFFFWIPAEKFRAKIDANLSDAKGAAKHGANTNFDHTKYGAIRTWRRECVMDFCGIDWLSINKSILHQNNFNQSFLFTGREICVF